MAVRNLREIIGGANFSDEEKALKEYSGDVSFAPRIRPRCVVKPQSACSGRRKLTRRRYQRIKNTQF
jgi:hypothetical protein